MESLRSEVLGWLNKSPEKEEALKFVAVKGPKKTVEDFQKYE